MKTCIYCACTPTRACSVKVDEQPADIRDNVRAYYRSKGLDVPRFVGCSWISTNPDVCSALPCRKKHVQASAKVTA